MPGAKQRHTCMHDGHGLQQAQTATTRTQIATLQFATVVFMRCRCVWQAASNDLVAPGYIWNFAPVDGTAKLGGAVA